MQRLYLSIFVFLVLTVQGLQAKIASPKCLLPDIEGQLFENDAYWKYHKGDNPDWAELEFDASGWDSTNVTRFPEKHLPDEGFENIAWFRRTFTIDSTDFGKTIAIDMVISGAAQLYLNGKLQYSWGEISQNGEVNNHINKWKYSPHLMVLDSLKNQVIAVRYANDQPDFYFQNREYIGFDFLSGYYEPFLYNSISKTNSTLSTHNFTFGATTIITILHFLLFVFFPRQRTNLYYSLMTFGLMLVMIGNSHYRFDLVHERNLLFFYCFKLGLVTISVFSLHFIFSLFRSKLPKWIINSTYAGIIFALLIPVLPMPVYYFLTIICLPVCAIEIFRAIKNKYTGAKIIVDGLLVSFFFFGYQMLYEMGTIERSITIFPLHQEYLFGILITILTMSMFLAWQVGHTNRDLQIQLVNVKELSEKTIAQEREVQNEKLRLKNLEMENYQKDLELEEARKRQKILKELEDANNELELINQELMQTQAQLVQSEKMASLGLLTAGIAHEINTPVGAIYSTHGTLKKAVDNLNSIMEINDIEEIRSDRKIQNSLKALNDVAQVIKTGGDRISGIVKHMKTFVHLDKSERQRADLNQGIEDTLIMLKHKISSGITVKKELGELKPVLCNPGSLNQVFLNIILNAIQAIKGEGEVKIKTELSGDMTIVTVSDTGHGIAEKDLNHIFDPGFTRKGVGVGMGLGLSICYKIINDHNGSIEVKSEVGKGTEFILKLPNNG